MTVQEKLKSQPHRDYEMFSLSGNKGVQKLLEKVIDIIYSDKRVTLKELQGLLPQEMLSVSKKHPEVYDTEPQNHIEEWINKALKEVGYSFGISRWDFHLPVD